MFFFELPILVLEVSKHKRGRDDAFFDIVESRLTEDSFILSKVQDVIVDLESNSKVSAEVE